MTESNFNKELSQLAEQKNQIIEHGRQLYQQLIFCSTTVLVLLVGFNQSNSNVLFKLIYTIELVLLTTCIILLLVLIQAPFRQVSEAHQKYIQNLRDKLSNKISNATTFASQTKYEKFAQKWVIKIFVLAMIFLLIIGLLKM